MNDLPLLSQPSQARFVMCRPQYFAATYSINPWMDPKAWADSGSVLHATAVRQWTGLHRTLQANRAAIETIDPEPGLPDLVFTANAAVVLDRKALLARFFHPERQREQPVLMAAFRALHARGFIDDIVETPEGVALEGAGDCIWDRQRGLFWMGSGFRSDVVAAKVIERQFGVGCVPLALADPSFYHLDTAFSAAARRRSLFSRRLRAGGARNYPPPCAASAPYRARPRRRRTICRQRRSPRAYCGAFELQRRAPHHPGRSRLQGRRDPVARFPTQWWIGLLPDASPRSQYRSRKGCRCPFAGASRQ